MLKREHAFIWTILIAVVILIAQSWWEERACVSKCYIVHPRDHCNSARVWDDLVECFNHEVDGCEQCQVNKCGLDIEEVQKADTCVANMREYYLTNEKHSQYPLPM